LAILFAVRHGIFGGIESAVDLSYISDTALPHFFEGKGKSASARIKTSFARAPAELPSISRLGEPLTDLQGIMSGISTYLGSQPMIESSRGDERG
jgi:hypothetical protein